MREKPLERNEKAYPEDDNARSDKREANNRLLVPLFYEILIFVYLGLVKNAPGRGGVVQLFLNVFGVVVI